MPSTLVVGRIVHYTSPRDGKLDCQVAIITAVKEKPNAAHSGIVNLCVLHSNGMQFVVDVPFVLRGAVKPNFGGSWHWPEQE